MQGNQLVAKYIIKFDEFLIMCDENKSDTIVFSRFRSGLMEDLRCELCERYLYFKQSYHLV